MTYASLAAEHAQRLKKDISDFEESDEQLGVQGFASSLRKRLRDLGLGYVRENVPLGEIAVWEENREFEMLIPARVHVLVATFCQKGFSAEDTLLSLSREVSEGAAGELTRQKNKALIESTRVQLQHPTPQRMRFFFNWKCFSTGILVTSF